MKDWWVFYEGNQVERMPPNPGHAGFRKLPLKEGAAQAQTSGLINTRRCFSLTLTIQIVDLPVQAVTVGCHIGFQAAELALQLAKTVTGIGQGVPG